MIPLVDTHCHLLAGLDDGPPDLDEAVAMCRLAWEDGTRVIAATSHISELWPAATPQRIRRRADRLADELKQIGLPLTVYPAGEAMIRPDLDAVWQRGGLVGMGGGQMYLLVEFPPGLFFDIRSLIHSFEELGVRLILAHPERHAELLYTPGPIEELIRGGCLVQVTAESLVSPASREELRALKRWFQRDIVHLVASDGHSVTRRRPQMAEAYRRVVDWVGADAAGRICSINGLIVLEGLPLRVPEPKRPARHWFARCWGAS